MIRILLTAVFVLFVGTALGMDQAWCEESKFPWVVDPGQKVVWGSLGWLNNDRVAFVGEETEGKSVTGNRLRVWNTRTGEITDHQTDVVSLCANERVFGYFHVPRVLPDDWPRFYRKPFWLYGGWHRGRFPVARRMELPKELSDAALCIVKKECQNRETVRMAVQILETSYTDFTNCRVRKVGLDLFWSIPLRDGDGELLTGTLPKTVPANSTNFRFRKPGAADSMELPIPVIQVYPVVTFYPFKGAYFLHRNQEVGKAEKDSGKLPAPWPAWWLWPDGRVERLDVPRGLDGPAYPTKLGLLQVHYSSSKREEEMGVYLFLPKGPVEVLPYVFRGPYGPPVVSPNGCKVAFRHYKKLRMLNLCRHREAIERLPVYRFKSLDGAVHRVPVE